MKPAPFHYIAPSTLMEALDVMSQHGADAKLLAGGQSLIPVMNFRLAQPAVIVDLNKVTELSGMQLTGGDSLRDSPESRSGGGAILENRATAGLRIGAMVRHSQVEHSALVAAHAPLLHEAMPLIAHPQIRNRGTIGGSLAHADPAAELPVVMVALQARFLLQKSGHERWVAAEAFYESLFTTALEPDEILVEVDIPPPAHGAGAAFLEVARRHGDYAQAGVAALIALDEDGICRQARLVYLNVGEIPLVAQEAAALLVGHRPTTELIHDTAMHAGRHEIDPMADIHATADYRRHLAFVLGQRALAQAVAIARDGRNLE